MLLSARAMRVVSVGRQGRDVADYHAFDLTSAGGRRALAAVIADLHPVYVVLAHGPSDITWTEHNEDTAATVHGGVARSVALSGAPAVLVSTDNVFPGNRGRYRREDGVAPANSYGRVKADAEDILLAGGSALVLRVSLVYGWTGSDHRATFGQRCLQAAARGHPMAAPTDQVFTPIHVRDVATVISAVCGSEHHLNGVEHLAGPAELSRYDFARLAYRLAKADPRLVRPCRRQDTVWSCRPAFSSLTCGNFTSLPGLATWRPMSPHEGLGDMIAQPDASLLGLRAPTGTRLP